MITMLQKNSDTLASNLSLLHNSNKIVFTDPYLAKFLDT